MTRLARVLAWVLALGVVMAPLVAVLNGWMAPQRWPIRHLQVTAEYQRVSAEEVRATVARHLGQGYFDTDPGIVRSALAALPWVRHAEVRKRWPDRLEVLLVEHRARAHWGEDRLLSDEGIVFAVPGAAELQGLPFLAGPDERMDEVLDLHERARRLLSGAGLMLEGTRLSRRGSWTLSLRGGARIVAGRQADPEARLARLVRVLPKVLTGERRAMRSIDLRYPDGFAVAWVQEMPESPAPGAAAATRGGSGAPPSPDPLASRTASAFLVPGLARPRTPHSIFTIPGFST